MIKYEQCVSPIRFDQAGKSCRLLVLINAVIVFIEVIAVSSRSYSWFSSLRLRLHSLLFQSLCFKVKTTFQYLIFSSHLYVLSILDRHSAWFLPWVSIFFWTFLVFRLKLQLLWNILCKVEIGLIWNNLVIIHNWLLSFLWQV